VCREGHCALKKETERKKKTGGGCHSKPLSANASYKIGTTKRKGKGRERRKKKGGGNEEKYGFNEGKHKTHLALLRVGEVTASGEEAQQAVHELPLSPFLKKKTANV
jgi:hypothetical protein